MTQKEFNNYTKVANSVVDLLLKNNLSSIYDIETIYHIIRCYPYCLDQAGHYTYNGHYYNSLEDLPLEALKQIYIVRNDTFFLEKMC